MYLQSDGAPLPSPPPPVVQMYICRIRVLTLHVALHNLHDFPAESKQPYQPLYLQSDGAPSPLLHHWYICRIHVLTSPTETMISVRVLSSECMDSYS